MEQLLSIGFNKEFDIINRTEHIETYLKINTRAIKEGLINKLGPTDFSVLMAIASFLDIEGNCYPTQRQIATITGMSLTTVNTSISRLLKFTINDRPLLERELKGDGIKKNSYYSFMRYSDNLEALDINSSQLNIKSAKYYLELFCKTYEETFETPYIPNYARDMKLIKDRLISTYQEDDIIYIINTGIKTFMNKYSSAKYKYPTIPMITGWLANKIMTDKANDKKILNNVNSIEETYEGIDWSKML